MIIVYSITIMICDFETITNMLSFILLFPFLHILIIICFFNIVEIYISHDQTNCVKYIKEKDY
jgi:hypothetical protein